LDAIDLTPPSKKRLDNKAVQATYDQHVAALERFLAGILRDRNLVADTLQISFTRLLEKGGDVRPGAIKSWLFRVAYNEAMLIHRKRDVDQRAKESIGWTMPWADHENEGFHSLAKQERSEEVQRALETLPEKQKQIVLLRVREGLKFAQIAEQLEIPLGTVLTRMRSGLQKLKDQLTDEV
jgi:RNA polymerase sigma-70 factor (ECF subfamily)